MRRAPRVRIPAVVVKRGEIVGKGGGEGAGSRQAADLEDVDHGTLEYKVGRVASHRQDVSRV